MKNFLLIKMSDEQIFIDDEKRNSQKVWRGTF